MADQGALRSGRAAEGTAEWDKKGDKSQRSLVPRAELNSLLFWTCRLGQQLRALIQKASEERGGRISFKPLADHFDSFVTRYEALLEKLPEELHV